MNSASIDSALRQYKKITIEQGAADASPYRLILMLMDGAVTRIAVAKGQIQRREIASKGEVIGSIISIIEGLRVSLDKDKGGELAGNLEALYDYMERRLVEANLKNNPAILEEVADLLGQIREAWVAIEPTAKEMGQA